MRVYKVEIYWNTQYIPVSQFYRYFLGKSRLRTAAILQSPYDRSDLLINRGHRWQIKMTNERQYKESAVVKPWHKRPGWKGTQPSSYHIYWLLWLQPGRWVGLKSHIYINDGPIILPDLSHNGDSLTIGCVVFNCRSLKMLQVNEGWRVSLDIYLFKCAWASVGSKGFWEEEKKKKLINLGGIIVKYFKCTRDRNHLTRETEMIMKRPHTHRHTHFIDTLLLTSLPPSVLFSISSLSCSPNWQLSPMLF